MKWITEHRIGFGKKLSLFFAFACLIGPLCAQINPEPYLFSSQIENDVKLNQIPIRKAVEFSFIGAYEKALATYELDQSVREDSGEKESALSTEEKIPLAVPADVIEIDGNVQQGTLVLLPGLYDVEIENEKGEKQVFEIRVE